MPRLAVPESFSRLAAINGGTFMLNRPVDEVLLLGDDLQSSVGNSVVPSRILIPLPQVSRQRMTLMPSLIVPIR